jgi:hypothetical protein
VYNGRMERETTWKDLKDIKESDPVYLAEYAVANKLVEEPAFKWWVPYTLKKRDQIIKAVKRRFHRKNKKFGMEIPHLVKRALEIDRETETDHWAVALAKEMKNMWPVLLGVLQIRQVGTCWFYSH